MKYFFCIKLINKKYNLINSQKDDFNIFILNDNEKVERKISKVYIWRYWKSFRVYKYTLWENRVHWTTEQLL